MRRILVRSLLAAAPGVLSLAPVALMAQAPVAVVPADVLAERAAFADWLATAPVSPAAAVSAAPLGAEGVTFEANGHPVRVLERAGVPWAEGDGPARPLPRNRPIRFGHLTVLVTGESPRSRIMMFQPGRPAHASSPMVQSGAVRCPRQR